MKNSILLTTAVFALLSACATEPLAPTADAARVAQLKTGLTAAEVEGIMGRKGAVVGYSTRPGEVTQVWPYAEHFKDLCLVVTYDTSGRVESFASIEKDKGPGRFSLPGGCR